jgi:hypothetical protein
MRARDTGKASNEFHPRYSIYISGFNTTTREKMKKTMIGDCPCGFHFTTPHGEDDAVAVLQNHVQRIHLKDYPKGLSKEEALKSIKEMEPQPT